MEKPNGLVTTVDANLDGTFTIIGTKHNLSEEQFNALCKLQGGHYIIFHDYSQPKIEKNPNTFIWRESKTYPEGKEIV